MQNISKPFQRHRQQTGQYDVWLKKRHVNPRLSQQYLQKIAARPGLHSGNVSRQNMACAMLQLCSILSAVNNSDTLLTPAENKKTPFTGVQSLSLSGQYYHSATNFLKSSGLKKTEIATLPIVEKQPSVFGRTRRNIVPSVKVNTSLSVMDEVEIVKSHDLSCMNEGEDSSFGEILKQISLSLQQPITMLTIETKNIASWNKGVGCPRVNDIQDIINITEKIDYIVSQVISILPNSQPVNIIQGIVAPLLERVANDLTGDSISREQDLEQLQQIIQQARITIKATDHMTQMSLGLRPGIHAKKIKPELPQFQIKNGVNHIDIEYQGGSHSFPIRDKYGQVFADIPGEENIGRRYHPVYFNFLTKKWKMMGSGRFNRFSHQERQLVHQFSLGVHYLSKEQLTDQPPIYTVLNAYFPQPEKLIAIEMFGQLVPVRYQSETDKWFIYDAAQPNGQIYEIVLARNEWHLKNRSAHKIKYQSLFSPEYGRELKVDVLREVNGRKIYAQINTDTGFLWGKKFTLNKHGHLELLSADKKHDRYYKNTIYKLAATEQLQLATDNTLEKENLIVTLFYEQGSGCFRVKRGAVIGHMCHDQDVNSGYQLMEEIKNNKYPIIAEGSIGIVYDYNNGMVIKKYKGKVDERHKSRLLAANNNTKGFNRFYGASSATIGTHSNGDGTITVFTKLKKIEGIPLSTIHTLTDETLLNTLLTIIENDKPAEQLSSRLKKSGIIHNDLNKGNVIYNPEHGFDIIDFDSAIILPAGEMVSLEITETMKNKFLYVFNDTLRDIITRLAKLKKMAQKNH